MSTTQCRHFVQNAWKKDLCSNCFKSREEHIAVQDQVRPFAKSTASSVKRVAHKVQGILRIKENTSNSNQVRCKRKNVAFPESLAEIIGYDGGDDFEDEDADSAYSNSSDFDDPDSNESSFEVDDIPDSEEERALGNLTRANTNFNTVTANLSAKIDSNETSKSSAKNFSSLMLGRAPKSSDGKKTTLLVTVTPFGGDDSVPTAKRPVDKKPTEATKPKLNNVITNNNNETSEPNKTDLSSLKTAKKSEPIESATIKTKTITSNNNSSSSSNNSSSNVITTPTTSPSSCKIVDMPLITSSSSSLITSSLRDDSSKTTEQKRPAAGIARTPAIKRTENEKARIVREVVQQQNDSNTVKNHKNLEISSGVELNLAPIRTTESTTTTTTIKEKPSLIKASQEVSVYNSKNSTLADLTERKVEGEAAACASMNNEKYPESRESAGEPDGKADEEVVNEPSPPALPKSPPPIDSSPPPSYEKRLSTSAEPRNSFLHGINESKAKPTIPQKPVSLPTKVVGSSLASLLSENRAYEYRLSQAAAAQARNNSGGLVHSQSESHLLNAVDEAGNKKIVGQQEAQKVSSSESCGQLNPRTDNLFKASVVKTVIKDDQNENEGAEIEDDVEEEEESSESSSTTMDQQQQQLRSSPSKRRQAPLPPNSPSTAMTGDDISSSLFARNPNSPNNGVKSDCPVVREKEKRERASSCSPKFRQGVSDAPDPTAATASFSKSAPLPPEPAPRRNISLSQDSLATAANSYERVVEEKKKARSKFSLKKFLRMGSRKDVDMTCGSSSFEIPSTPQPKPRLEIIHPLELDGAAVQVLRNDKSTSSEISTPTESKSENQSASPSGVSQHVATRPSKPPPPPRAQSLDDSSRPNNIRPIPPKAQQPNGKPLVGKSWQPSSGSSASDSIYANLGKFRPIQCN